METIRRNHYLLIILAIVLVAALVRFPLVGTTPWDWDDPIHTSIAQNVTQLGYPASEPEPGKMLVPYLYHPPFHFHLLNGWFRVVGDNDIHSARLLSASLGILAVLVCMWFVSEITRNRTVTILAGLFVAIDGWSTYSSILVKFDTPVLILGMTGLLLYSRALRNNKSWLFVILAGTAIGMTIIYKHTGVVFAAAILVNWLLFVGKQHRNHVLILGIALGIVLIYVGTMYAIWGEDYLDQSLAQVRRSLGLQEARGLNFGIPEVFNALGSRYWIFGGSILTLLAGGLIVLMRSGQMLFRGREENLTVVLSWAIAAAAFTFAVSLRNPHYLVMLIVPLSIVIAHELTRLKMMNLALVAVISLFALNLGTLGFRVLEMNDTNALQEVQTYIMQNIPADQSILTEEAVCALVENPCYMLGTTRSQKSLREVNPAYLVVYTTTTHLAPETEAFRATMQESSLVFMTKGWKEEIRIYQIKKNPSWQ